MQFLRITIQGFDFRYIRKAIQKMENMFCFFKLKKNKIYTQPSGIKKFTLERSPHIDKKSREQFEIRKYKTIIDIELKNSIITQVLYYIIKNSNYPGVQITISIQFQAFLI